MDQKILVVDDSKTVCQATKFAFTVSPYSVDVAHTAADALRMLRSSDYAGAIIDYVLPDQSGVDLLRAIREDHSLRPLPVVILHGSYHPFDPAEAKAAGADALLVKPFLTDEILGEISNAIAAAPNRPEPGSRPALVPPAPAIAPPAPAASEDVSDDFDIITEGEPTNDYQTPPPRAAAAPPPAPMAGTFRRVAPSPNPVADAPPSPRRPPLAPPPPSPLRGGFAQPPPPSRMPASARTAVPTTETSTTENVGPHSAPTDEIRTTRQVDAVTGNVERVPSEESVADQPAITEPVSASGSVPAALDPPASAPVADNAPVTPESAPDIVASSPDEPGTTAPPAPSAPNVTVDVDPDMVKALVREMLPGIVKEFLSSMLRQTGQKLEQYSQAKIDTYVEQELPSIARKAIDEALAGIVGEE